EFRRVLFRSIAAAQAGLGGGNSVVQRVIRNQQVGIEIAPDSWLDFRRVNGGRGAAGKSGARGRNGNEVAHDSCNFYFQAVSLRSLAPTTPFSHTTVDCPDRKSVV